MMTTVEAATTNWNSTSRRKLLRLTRSYVKRHITRARHKVANGFSYPENKILYQRQIADLDTDNLEGTYCYHCRRLVLINDLAVTHARNSLARVYHSDCARLINVWP